MTKIYVFFSGGKDSQACLILAAKKYGIDNIQAVFCDTGWENPVTYDHIHKVCDSMGVRLITIKSEKYDGMVDLAVKKKLFPSTKARFCTEELKVRPSIDFVLSQKSNVIIIEGIRGAESKQRSLMSNQCSYFKYYFEPYGHDKDGKPRYRTYRKKEVIEWTKQYNADIERLVFNHSAQDVIDSIIKKGQQPNPLYYNGFSRVGCFPCFMASHRDIKQIIKVYPERIKELIEAEAKVGRSFFPPSYIPKWACKNGEFPFIDDVVKYLNEKDATIDAFESETPTCMSLYGLCE